MSSKMTPAIIMKLTLVFVALGILVSSCAQSPNMNVKFSSKDTIVRDTLLTTTTPLTLDYTVKGALTKRVSLQLDNPKDYANISLYSNDELLVDNLNIPSKGSHQVNAIVVFQSLGDVKLSLRSNHADINIASMMIQDVNGLTMPSYEDISVKAGIDKVSSIKYGGPTIADLDNDGDYDFIVNNHNEESSKLYWNNGDGTVTKHNKNLSRWFLQDLHGTAAGDYDNDGDLDLVLSLGGGNGKNPSKANFYQNNDGQFILKTGDVGIKKGARGRGANWSDMDLDGDLDLMLINETSLYYKNDPQHHFYENLGDGKLVYKQIPNLEMNRAHRAIVTDINNDNIDDVVLYGPLSLWLGNGDFTFTEVTSQLPKHITQLKQVMAVTDIDIDNDGDLDLYIARGKEFEHGYGETPWIDMDPIKKEFSIRSRGYTGVDTFEFTADGAVTLNKYYFLAQGIFRGQEHPIYLGSKKEPSILNSGDELVFSPENAQGWPDDISENGVYFGHIGNGRWRAALVRNGDVFWGFKFSLLGVNEAFVDFEPQNRNDRDFLLRNDGDKFTDVSKEWNIPTGSNSLGVTTGDFNNDSHQDLLVYRWGLVSERIADYMLVNNGKGSFDTLTMHGASDKGGPGHGDMGQAFDFDLDGDLDILSGSENGEWYLYANQTNSSANYALVDVGYAPVSNIDAIAAVVTVKTPNHEYQKRVGSAGSIFSQSLLNIVHFGLGGEDTIEQIKVRWRNGEEIIITDKQANTLFDTDKVDPTKVAFSPSNTSLRKGESKMFAPVFSPKNANTEITWSSSNTSVLSVDRQGLVTAIGDVNQTAVITATSLVNDVSGEVLVSIEKWYAKPLLSVKVKASANKLIVGEQLAMQVNLQPQDADDASLRWSSSDDAVVSVDDTGLVSAIKPGNVTITATSNANPQVNNSYNLTVEPYVAPYLVLDDEEQFRSQILPIGENLTFNVKYHSGSGNTVISSDQGGMRFWLRHFKSPGGIAGKDYIITNTEVLGTAMGDISVDMPLHDGIIPSSELPKGHYYSLRISFTNSRGEVINKMITPVTLGKGSQ